MSSPSVLVVDDDADFRAMVRLRLEDVGVRVHEASTGDAALMAITTGSVPDLVIADLRLPGIDGREVRDHLAYSRPEVPVHVWSALPRTGADVSVKDLAVLSDLLRRHCGIKTS
ncbi:response regulator [Nocardioides sp. GY 10127]|uniref:response regulator n=1 Tax=Nocardioides sp. GY 10127 TaxID=2569762 RepID=UPI0010A82354|nr:response regulator [Nocardioides sp. GY 10127]TIC79295.1 response regulator [Nocardioides sp. GY 10127]